MLNLFWFTLLEVLFIEIDSIYLGPMVSQNIMAEEACSTSYSSHGGPEAE
jgi:hypothetical protein